ncbi:MAG: uncharacterized membrane protein YheB (UPF0754 family) [Glaciecola sp.]|jgi:uncharacterized membrane protein YheB (UPF0754 family)
MVLTAAMTWALAVLSHPVLAEGFLSVEKFKYLSIPVIAGIIGYGTNWLAVKMTFEPLEFVGFKAPYLGWQGIIPSRSKKMAAIAVDSTLSKLGSLSEIFEQMDPEQISEHLLAHMRPMVPEMVEEFAQRENPVLWNNTPDAIKAAVIARVDAQLPKAARSLMKETGEQIEHLLDLRMMVIDLLGKRPDLTNRMFWEAGEPEFKIIIKSGAYFGFALGLIQMAVQIVFDQWWVLPIFGVLVGYATNWLALKLIFEPVEPRKIGPVTLHGLFLRRQAEIADVYCRLVTREVLTLGHFVDHMLNGPRGDRTRKLVAKHTGPIMDESFGIIAPAVRQLVGSRDYDAMKSDLSVRAIEMSLDPLEDPVFSESRSAIVEATMKERMLALTSQEFANLLRPAFQEDELTLILVGAVLGGVAGGLQSLLVF